MKSSLIILISSWIFIISGCTTIEPIEFDQEPQINAIETPMEDREPTVQSEIATTLDDEITMPLD